MNTTLLCQFTPISTRPNNQLHNHGLKSSLQTPDSLMFSGTVTPKQPAPRVELETESFTQPSLEGRTLSLRQWWPKGQSKPLVQPGQSPVLLIPGYGGRSGWGAPLANELLSDFPYVYGLNLPVLDGDPAERKPFQGSEDLLKEVQEAIQTISKQHQAPVTVIGTSIGGLLSTICSAETPEMVNKLVLIAPAYKPSSKLINPLTAASSLLHGILKGLGLRKKRHFELKGAEADLGKIKSADGKKKNHGMAITPGMMWSFLKVAYSGRVQKSAKAIKTPTLMFIAGQDKMCSASASKKVFKTLSSTDKRLVQLPQARHNLVRDEDIVGVSNTIRQWLTSKA